jgi:hypothetical protein
MATVKGPGENSGNNGGIYQEVGPRGGVRPNWVTVPDNKTLPPTSEPKHKWKQVRRTPDSDRD